MRAFRTASLAVLLLLLVPPAGAYTVYYKEQFWKLFHTHYIQYPDDAIENIYWLEQAKKADFCNPLYALATIENETEWRRYRALFEMHISLELIRQNLLLGSKFDKRVAYFYNAPWKEQNLESLKTAESAYRAALAWWPEAKAKALEAMKLRFVRLEEVAAWMDEAWRIEQGELDYAEIIADELQRLGKVRAAFEKMDAAGY
jgi:hypothetical protein